MAFQETLATLAVDLVADTSKLGTAFNRAVSDGAVYGGRVGDNFAYHVKHAMIAQLSGVGFYSVMRAMMENTLTGGVGYALGRAGFAVSRFASNAAAELDPYRFALERMTGSAEKAERVMRRLQNIAARSNYNTPEVLSMATRIMGRKGDVEGGIAQTQKYLDMAQAIGVRNVDFEQFQRNLDDLERVGGKKAHVVDIRQMLKRAPSFQFVAGKAIGMDPQEVNKRLYKMSGEEMMKLLDQIAEANKGLAEAAVYRTPQTAFRNIVDVMEQGMAPTGQRINAFLIPVARVGMALATAGREMNYYSQGVFGLVGIFNLFRLSAGLLINTGILVYRAFSTLNTSLNTLATSATLAANAVSRQGNASMMSAAASGVATNSAAASLLTAGAVASRLGMVPGTNISALRIGAGAGYSAGIPAYGYYGGAGIPTAVRVGANGAALGSTIFGIGASSTAPSSPIFNQAAGTSAFYAQRAAAATNVAAGVMGAVTKPTLMSRFMGSTLGKLIGPALILAKPLAGMFKGTGASMGMGLLGAGISWAGGAMAESGAGGPWGRVGSRALQWGGMAGSLGAMTGIWQVAAVMGVLGAIAGAAVQGYNEYQTGGKGPGSAGYELRNAAKDLKEAAGDLAQFSARIIGGGPRANAGMGQFQSEYLRFHLIFGAKEGML